MSLNPIETWLERDSRLLRIRLAQPKANIVDIAMISALEVTLDVYEKKSDLMGALLDHEGPHFGYGASVPEHLPNKVHKLVGNLHRMLKKMLAFPVPILAVVRGQCVGGSLELASAGHLIFATPDAMFGQPEVKLGTLAPVASCILPERIGRVHAEDLLISGRTIPAETAKVIGLISDVSTDPEAAALAYFDKHLVPHSPAGLRFAVRSVRRAFLNRVIAELDAVERIYLHELMNTPDPVEGLTAFMEKRPPVWKTA